LKESGEESSEKQGNGDLRGMSKQIEHQGTQVSGDQEED
jgi:hypothetical protein